MLQATRVREPQGVPEEAGREWGTPNRGRGTWGEGHAGAGAAQGWSAGPSWGLPQR